MENWNRHRRTGIVTGELERVGPAPHDTRQYIIHSKIYIPHDPYTLTIMMEVTKEILCMNPACKNCACFDHQRKDTSLGQVTCASNMCKCIVEMFGVDYIKEYYDNAMFISEYPYVAKFKDDRDTIRKKLLDKMNVPSKNQAANDISTVLAGVQMTEDASRTFRKPE
jgi:hypothetical protein